LACLDSTAAQICSLCCSEHYHMFV